MRQRGFSLLEVLVAFSILALSLGVLMRIYSGALNHVGIARDQAEALIIAQSLLADTGVEVPLVAGETTGNHGDRFHWRMMVAHYAPAADEAGGQSALLSLWEISLQVTWGDGSGQGDRVISLKSLRAQGKAPR